jgi:hypothetical protein
VPNDVAVEVFNLLSVKLYQLWEEKVLTPSATCYINKNGKVYTCFMLFLCNFAYLIDLNIRLLQLQRKKERKKERKKNWNVYMF